jgi:RNA polymerase sigma factor (sigma-70 family)
MEESLEIFFDRIENYETLSEKLKEAAACHSLDYLRYEQEMTCLLNSLGLEFGDHTRLDNLIPEMETLWSDYLDLRDQVVSPYFRLVYSIADGFSQSDSQTLDNFQNGLIGLLRAYKCYTPSRFAAFSLVAEQWIKQSILLHIKTEVNFIKLPIANWHSYQKLEKIKNKIEQRTNREAQPAEIALEAKMAVDKVKKIYENVKLAKVLSLNVPTANEEEQSDGPAWALESVTDEKNVQDALEAEAEYQTVRRVVCQFDVEETIIFAFISGCLDLIENSELSKTDIEKETIRQRAARQGIGITFK